MSALRVSLPPSLESFVDEQVADGGFATRGAYVRERIRRDRNRQHFRCLLLEGGESAASIAADTSYFRKLRTGVMSQVPTGESR